MPLGVSAKLVVPQLKTRNPRSNGERRNAIDLVDSLTPDSIFPSPLASQVDHGSTAGSGIGA